MDTAMRTAGVVHVVDDDDDCRKGIARLLSASGLNAIEHRSAGEYLASVGRDNDASCVLLDMYLEDTTGLDVLMELANHKRATSIVFMSGNSDIGTAVQSMRAGALDFLVKPVSAERLIAAVQVALNEDALRREEDKQCNELKAAFATLTEQERTVFHNLVNGWLNKQIAANLGTCERTVKTHRSRVMLKMHAQSVAHLVRIANRLDLLDPYAE